MPYASNGTARLFWEERGSGTPVLLVMGHTYPSAMWYAAADALAAKHRVVTFDNRGTGQSSPVTRMSVGDMARDAFAVMDAAGIDAAHAYGVSMGGGIVLEMARQRPERVRSLVLGCTMAKTPDVPSLPAYLRPLLHLPAPVLARLIKAISKRPKDAGEGTAADPAKVAEWEQVVAANPTRVKTSVEQTKAINDYVITPEEVRALRMPALVVHGTEDPAVPYEAGKTLHELIAHSEMLTIPGAGHNYFLAAADEANATVLDFLSRADADEAVAV